MKTSRKVYVLILSALLITSMLPFYVFANAPAATGTDSEASVEVAKEDQQKSDDSKPADSVGVDQKTVADDSSKEEVNTDNKQDAENEPEEQAAPAAEEKTYKQEATKQEKTYLANGSRLEFEDKNYTVSATVDKAAKLPEGTDLTVEELDKKSDDFDYEKYYKETLDALQKDSPDVSGINFVKFYDITLVSEGEAVEPSVAVNVKISYDKEVKVSDADKIRIVHFAEKKGGGEKAVVLDSNKDNVVTKVKNDKLTEASFDAASFSKFAVVEVKTIEKTVITADDETYKVSVQYDESAKLPEDVGLEVTEYAKDSNEFAEAYSQLFGEEPGDDPQMMAFDISITDKNGKEIEPSAPVKVSMKVENLPEDISSEELQKNITIAHIKEENGSKSVEEVAGGNEILVGESIETTFTVDSFSTFTIMWGYNGYSLQTQLVDENGISVGTNMSVRINSASSVAELAPDIEGYEFVRATVGTTTIQRIRRNYGFWQYNTSLDGGTWRDINNTVSFIYREATGPVKVYVYVAAYDTTVTPRIEWKNSPEFLELLGISGETVDVNGYFPVGEIEVDRSVFAGRTSPYIKSQDDWQKVLHALGALNTTTLVDQYGIPYSENRNNNVGEYIDHAIGDINYGAGSQHTALFDWRSGVHSYGFDDQSVRYHLDLRFQTNKVTFITGNNDITSGAAKDGTTVDTRAYIVNSLIQEPRNMPIPEGYRFVGYYNDPDFTTPWNKIGTPLQQDETVYIKITPKDNVIIHYEAVPDSAGTVSVDAEGLNPDTGIAQGSTATASPGYKFDGWYADRNCEQLLSNDPTFIPEKPEGGWVEGTTYYAHFVEDTVTLTFIAEEKVDHVELVTPVGDVIAVTGNNTKEMKVTVNALTGPAVTVRGVAEDGYVIKEWTIDGKDGALTTQESITTAITDDPYASTLWTDRTYRVWAETAKRISVEKQVQVVGTVDDEDVNLTVYFALKKKGESDFVQKDGKVWVETVKVVGGVPQAPTTVLFDGVQSGTYDVWEVADENGSSLLQGDVVIPSDSQGKPILVTTIHTYHGASTSNNVTVNDESPEDHLLVVDTYAHPGETMDFVVNKQWYSEVNTYNDDSKANVNVPDGAWSELSLFIKGQESADPIRTIRLDGEADDDGETPAWVATFDGIATVDHDGKPIQYIVRETGYSEDLGGEHYYAIKDSVEQSNQSIKNAVVEGSISINKEIDVLPRTSEMDATVAESLSKLKIHVTGPYGYDEVFTFTDVSDPYNPKLVINDLPAGKYKVEEIGYVDLIEGRKWNPTLSWIKEGNDAPHMGEVDLSVSLTDVNTPNVTIHNDYTKYDIKATKVWNDLDIAGLNHPSVRITLYRIDSQGKRTSVGTKFVPANATGENLTVSWTNQEQQEQQYTYEIVEAPVDGYSCTSITGDMFTGFTVTNTYAPDLTVAKTVAGDYADLTKSFEFTFGLKDSSGGDITGNFDYTIFHMSGEEKVVDSTGSISNGGTFELKHNQRIEIQNLPPNSEATVTEKQDTNYDTYIDGDTKTNKATVTMSEDKGVSVRNVMKPIIITGIDGRSAAIIVVVLAALAGVGLFALKRARRRRAS